MQRLHIFLCSVLALGLICSPGCKKEEAEASPEPEKVSEPTTSTKSGALKDESEKEPSDRALRVQKKAKKNPQTTKQANDVAKAKKKKITPKKKDRPGAKPGKPSGRATKSAAKTPGVPTVARPKVAARKIARATNDDEYDEPTDKREPRKPVARAGGPRTRQPMRDSKRMEPENTDAPPRPAKANPKKLNQANDANTFRNSRRTPKAVAATGNKRGAANARPAALPTRVRPNAEQLLRKDDLTTLLKLKNAVDVHELSGISADHEYDGIYWGSLDGSKYYVGLQLWKMRSPIEAQRQYTQMVRSYPNAEETTAVTSKTFLAYWNEFIYLVYLDTTKQSVVAVTCHEKVCTEPSLLVGIAQKSRERL